MMKLKKAILFSVFLLLFLLPVKAEAATVAKIGSKKYSSIKSAVSSVKNGQTIKITKNAKWVIKKYESLELRNKKVTMDLGGHTVTFSSARGSRGIVKLTKSTLTIKNGTLKDDGKNEFSFQAEKKSKLNLTNLKMDISYSNFQASGKGSGINVKKVNVTHKAGSRSCFMLYYGAAGVFNSGSFTTYCSLISNYGGNVSIKGGDYTYPECNYSTSMISNDRTTDMNGKKWIGKITVSGGSFKSDEIIISNNIGADLTISGNASFEGNYPIFSQGTFTMTGGEIHATTYKTGYYGRPAVDSSSAPSGCTVTLTGGTLISDGNAAVIISKDTRYSNTGAVLKPGAGYDGMKQS